MIPSVPEIQQAIIRLTHLVLKVTKGITCWQREYTVDYTNNKGESLSADA